MQKLITKCGEAEVNELDLALDRVKYDILQFDIAMRNFVILQRLDGKQQLPQNLNSLLDGELLISDLVFAYRVQALALQHFHHEVYLINSFNTFIEFQDVCAACPFAFFYL